MMDIQSIDVRLVELEMRLSFQEDTLQKLNEVITQQARVIQKLERETASMQAQLKNIAPSLIADADQETPPPHY